MPRAERLQIRADEKILARGLVCMVDIPCRLGDAFGVAVGAERLLGEHDRPRPRPSHRAIEAPERDVAASMLERLGMRGTPPAFDSCGASRLEAVLQELH